MDPQRFKEAYARLRALDEGHTYQVRPRSRRSRLTTEQLEDKLQEMARYTIELREIVEDLFQAIAGRPTNSGK